MKERKQQRTVVHLFHRVQFYVVASSKYKSTYHASEHMLYLECLHAKENIL